MYFVNTNKIAQLMQWSNRRRLDHFDLKHVLRGCFLIGFVKLHFIVYSLSHFSKRFVEPWKVAQKTLRWNVLFFFDAHAVLFCFSPFEWLPLWKVRLNRHALKSMLFVRVDSLTYFYSVTKGLSPRLYHKLQEQK